MAQLTISGFLTKWAGLFADNSVRAISEEDMRNFREDIADSFFNTLDILSTVGAPFVFCGNVDLSGDAFPTTGGTGSGGAIKRGNSFRVSVATNAGISGVGSIDVNAEIIALQD